MNKLSNYIYNTVSLLGRDFQRINIVNVIDSDTFSIGNLVIREYYTKSNRGYSYCKETMIVSGATRNDYLGLQLKTVVSLEGNIAIVTDQIENLFYYNNRWFNTLDESEPSDVETESIRCEILTPININKVVKRTYIADNYFYEENGSIKTGPAPLMDIPAWCPPAPR